MYVAEVPNRDSPPAFLLRESYRENGKVKNSTLANISSWPRPRIDALRRASYPLPLRCHQHVLGKRAQCVGGVWLSPGRQERQAADRDWIVDRSIGRAAGGARVSREHGRSEDRRHADRDPDQAVCGS